MVRRGGQGVGAIGGRDADDAAIAGREGVDGGAVVAGSGHEDGATCPRVVDRGLEGGRVAGVAEAHEDDVGARIGGVHDAGDDVAVLAEAIGVEDGDREDRDARVRGAGHAGPVVGLSGHQAGHPGAVAVRVAATIACADDRGTREHDAVEVGMRPVDAGVEDGDRGGATDGDAAVEIGPADLRKRPLVVERGIGRRGLDRSGAIQLDARGRPRWRAAPRAGRRRYRRRGRSSASRAAG